MGSHVVAAAPIHRCCCCYDMTTPSQWSKHVMACRINVVAATTCYDIPAITECPLIAPRSLPPLHPANRYHRHPDRPQYLLAASLTPLLHAPQDFSAPNPSLRFWPPGTPCWMPIS